MVFLLTGLVFGHGSCLPLHIGVCPWCSWAFRFQRAAKTRRHASKRFGFPWRLRTMMASSSTFTLSVDSGSSISQMAAGGRTSLSSARPRSGIADRPNPHLYSWQRATAHSTTTTRTRSKTRLVTAFEPYGPSPPVGCTIPTRNPRTSHGSLRRPRLFTSIACPRAGPRTTRRIVRQESRPPAPTPLPLGAHTPD